MADYRELLELDYLPYSGDAVSGMSPSDYYQYIQQARRENARRKINDLTYQYAMKLYADGMLSGEAKKKLDYLDKVWRQEENVAFLKMVGNTLNWSHHGYIPGEKILDVVSDDVKGRNPSVSDWVKNIRWYLDYYRNNPNKDVVLFKDTSGKPYLDVYGVRDDEYDKLLNSTIDVLLQASVPSQKYYEIAAPAMSREIQEARADQGIGAKARYMGQYTVYPSVGVSTRRLRGTQPYYRRNVAGKIMEMKPLNPILKETK